MTRRQLLWLGVGGLGAVAAVSPIAADRLTRDPPNYTEIEPGLWLGGLVPAPPPGTAAVLNLCETPDRYRLPDHAWEPIADAEPAPPLDWLRDRVRWVDDRRRAGTVVYVHCLNGVSRSATVLAAYLMAREGWGRDRALGYLRERRPGVRPNPAFLRLLAEWEGRA